jgi:hypothetical protein
VRAVGSASGAQNPSGFGPCGFDPRPEHLLTAAAAHTALPTGEQRSWQLDTPVATFTLAHLSRGLSRLKEAAAKALPPGGALPRPALAYRCDERAVWLAFVATCEVPFAEVGLGAWKHSFKHREVVCAFPSIAIASAQ